MNEKREKIDKSKPSKLVNQVKKKSAKIMTAGDNLSGLFGVMKELFPPSTETASLSNDELYVRFIEGRLFNPLISDGEKAGLALIHRLRGDYEYPFLFLKRMYDLLNHTVLSDCIANDLKGKSKRKKKNYKSQLSKERQKLINQFLSFMGIKCLTPKGKQHNHSDKELFAYYNGYLTGWHEDTNWYPDAEERHKEGGTWEIKLHESQSPAEARDAVARRTGLTKHVVYKRLYKAGVEGVPSDNYDKKTP